LQNKTQKQHKTKSVKEEEKEQENEKEKKDLKLIWGKKKTFTYVNIKACEKNLFLIYMIVAKLTAFTHKAL
jgi:hypothetical protein